MILVLYLHVLLLEFEYLWLLSNLIVFTHYFKLDMK